MKQASNAFGASDGWVLYTSEDGHKYHWNHLTHESRWAKRADDRHAEVFFCCRTLPGAEILLLARKYIVMTAALHFAHEHDLTKEKED